MAHDGQDSVTSNPVVLDDLLTLTGAAVAPAETVLEAAKEAVRAMVVVDGRVSSRAVEVLLQRRRQVWMCAT